MIRGVNRQIIEINDTGNKYFERAMLFVRADYADLPTARLRGEADRMIAAIGSPSSTRKKSEVGQQGKGRVPLRSLRSRVRLGRLAALVCGAVIVGALIFFAVWQLI